jgi:dolichol-phosphate mannosyltransferase
MKNLSIILPTINESENLKILIPQIINELRVIENFSFEILVIDDQSTDNSEEVVLNLIQSFENIKFISRTNPPSLPMSIYEGIEKSKYEYVMWLDADGSMPAVDIIKLVFNQIKYPESIIIGSRFVEGGGYKGATVSKNSSFMSSLKNIYNSEDSILAVILSRYFNILLRNILGVSVKDITSGFIVGKKIYFNKQPFLNSSYGDYFIHLLKDIDKQNIECREVGYICLTRSYGVSKTGTNYLQLIKRGIPYVKAVFKIRNSND